jgi:alanine-synthesizing transaminase
VPLTADSDFIANLETAMQRTWPKPKMLIISFPANPTTHGGRPAFFERIVAFAREHDLMVVHDFAYAEICFDGYRRPASSRCPAPGTSPSSSSRSPRATRWPAGGWASPPATAT